LGVGLIGGVGMMRGWEIGALVCHAVWLDSHDGVVVMVQGLLVRLVGWVGVGRSSMLVRLLWLRERRVIVLSGDELVAQTWRRSQLVSYKLRKSKVRLTHLKGLRVLRIKSAMHRHGPTRVHVDLQQPKTWLSSSRSRCGYRCDCRRQHCRTGRVHVGHDISRHVGC
jgi:hypothetical protein